MWEQRYDRKRYWIWVAALLSLKIAAVVAVQLEPSWLRWVGHLDTGIAVGLAFVVGARFADAGWSRWLGVGLVLLVMVVLPIALMIMSLPQMAQASNPLDAMPASMVLATVALLALLIVAGVRPSVEASPPERLEPKF